MANTTTYADYQVLSSASTRLDASTNVKQVDFDFSIPSNTIVTNDSRRPVLSFMARVHKETMLKVFVNSQQILSWTLGTDLTIKGLWATWPAASVLVQFPNPVPVRFSVSTQGKIDIENVVMWYQVTDAQ